MKPHSEGLGVVVSTVLSVLFSVRRDVVDFSRRRELKRWSRIYSVRSCVEVRSVDVMSHSKPFSIPSIRFGSELVNTEKKKLWIRYLFDVY